MCLNYLNSIDLWVAVCNDSLAISRYSKLLIVSYTNRLNWFRMNWVSFSIINLSIPLNDFSVWWTCKYIFTSFHPFYCKEGSFLFVFSFRTHIGNKLGTHPFPIFPCWKRLWYLSLNRKKKLSISFLRVYDWAIAFIKVILSIVHVIDFRGSVVVVPLIW